MVDPREQLQHWAAGRSCLMGIGNLECGDDGFGVRLMRAIEERLGRGAPDARRPRFVDAGLEPERFIGRVSAEEVDHLVFLDAVDFGGEPGSIIFADAGEMAARFPQISTHKLSLGLLAKCVEENGHTRAWLVGVQPQSLGSVEGLTPEVAATLEALTDLLCEAWTTEKRGGEAPGDRGERPASAMGQVNV